MSIIGKNMSRVLQKYSVNDEEILHRSERTWEPPRTEYKDADKDRDVPSAVDRDVVLDEKDV